MECSNGLHFDATEIAYAFAHLLGAPIRDRKDAWDADFFRCGDTHSFGRLLVNAAHELGARVSRLEPPTEENGTRGTTVRLSSALSGIRIIGEWLQEQQQELE